MARAYSLFNVKNNTILTPKTVGSIRIMGGLGPEGSRLVRVT